MEANNPADEVSGATGTRCGVPVEGFPSGDSVAHSPRVSSLRTAENHDEERIAAEADVKRLLASGQCLTGGERDSTDKICSWIECSHDQRSWAEATEDQNRALPFTPVPARVEEAGPTMFCLSLIHI